MYKALWEMEGVNRFVYTNNKTLDIRYKLLTSSVMFIDIII